MALMNAQFSTVTVHSGPGEPEDQATQTHENWVLLLKATQRRHRANARARMELRAKGVDPDQFLAYHRK